MTKSIPKTASELIELLETIPGESPRDREAMIVAVRKLGRRIAGLRGIKADDMLGALDITDVEMLDHELIQLRVEALDVGDSTTKTYVSRLRKALRTAGLPIPDGRGHVGLSTSWKKIVAAAEKVDPSGINSLAKWANNRKIEPEAVDDEVIGEFSRDHVARRNTKSSTQTVRRIVATWNIIASENELRTLDNPLPYREIDTYACAIEELHPAVVEELDEFERRFLADGKRRIKPTQTRTSRLNDLLRLALGAYCKATRREPGNINSLAEICDPGNLLLAVKFMVFRVREKTGNNVPTTTTAYECSRAVRDFADYMLEQPLTSRQRLADMATALASGIPVERDEHGNRKMRVFAKSVPKEVGAKKRAVMVMLSHGEMADRLMSLPAVLFKEFRDDPCYHQETMTLLTHACALEIMMATSLWGHEVAALRLDQVTGASSRNSQACEISHGEEEPFVLVGAARDIVISYIEVVRPERPGSETVWMFPGRDGPWSRSTLGNGIRALTEKYLEFSVPPKDLRAIVALVFEQRNRRGHEALKKFLRLGDGPNRTLNTVDSIIAIRSNDGLLSPRREDCSSSRDQQPDLGSDKVEDDSNEN